VRSVRAEEIEREHGDGPSGRLEWVIKRAYDRKYDTTMITKWTWSARGRF